ncbi:bacillithiol biosynthesis deacetylase BshB1 [Paenibacillus campi]|uniref:bacillithiol biosynthesis deacetylase BshB1 n=1 Tax=Paenibacillus campi TaxID=3106031 RepID=UPI002B0021A1|nr:bacillithiol biosynthesis deacetylase BshB1 [Paenibacillus sp. SGZ-1009]
MSTKLDILVFGAHADDAEIGMAGTIIKHTSAGVRVGICDLTYAEMSSNGTVERRQQEAAAAAAVLGLSYRSNLGLPDRGLERNAAQLAAITAEIRRCAPRIVFAPYWEDRHPDHIWCSRLVEEAVFNAKLRRYMPELAPVQVEQLYYYFINDTAPASVLVDVTAHYERKVDALSCYASQFGLAAGDDTVATPLTQGYVERVRYRDAIAGQRSMIPYAEGFVTKTPFVAERLL